MSHRLRHRAYPLVLAVTLAVVALFMGLKGAQTQESTGGQDQPAAGDVGTSGLTPGGFTSKNVEYAGSFDFPDGEGGAEVPGFPELSTSTGASIRGDYMYLTSWKSISIYDISDPLDPEQTAYLPVGFMFENEDVATNGQILLFSESLPGNALHVYDVSDKTKIEEIATVEGAGDHTTECILGCKWAYGSDGSIVDLRDPANPKLMQKNWHELTGLNEDGAHDVKEFKNGFVITSPISDDLQYLDVRDPLNPKVLGRGTHPNPDAFLFHSGTWPRQGADRFLLMQGEQNFQPRCDRNQGPFMTFDASRVEETGRFRLIDRYRVENGAYADGAPAVNVLGCSSHWFEAHPTFENGGLVALGYYEHGTHFLKIGKDGQIKRVGYFLPTAGSTSAPYWVTNRIVYAVDYTRGIDILRYTGPLFR